MTHAYVLWIVLVATALHVLEEHTLDWRDWARQSLHVNVTWDDFYITNATMTVAGIGAAVIGWQRPEISLMLPALLVVNALVFHIGITIVQRRYSPGTFTAVVLYLPLAIWAYVAAHQNGALSARTIVVSSLGGILPMAFPLVLLRSRARMERGGQASQPAGSETEGVYGVNG